MKDVLIYIPQETPALRHAGILLARGGCALCLEPTEGMTHTLLPVPTKEVPQLPDSVTVFGGNLPPLPQEAVDLLQDPYYLAENAAITAYCALGILLGALKRSLQGQPVLLLGWGRISKCLAPLLKALGAQVTVAARKTGDRAMVTALGFSAAAFPLEDAKSFSCVINTVPAPVLEAKDCRQDALLLDLASKPGILGASVLWERGLPGRRMPESAGALIARTVLRYLNKEEALCG